MSDKMNFASEFPEATEMAEQVDTQLPEGTVDAAEVSRETYTLADGTEGSRAAFIREKFLNDNLSRKAISETYGFPYRVVYSATVNMVNEAESVGRGRATVNAVIKVTADNAFVNVTDEGIFVNGAAFDGALEALGELTDKNRNDWIIEQVAAGVSRGDIAKIMDLSYGVIYNITKELEGTRAKHEITLEDGSTVSRAEYIRRLYADGISRSDIVKQLDVPYSVVWQATKVEKSEQQKYQDSIETLRGYVDKVADAEKYMSLLDQLADIEITEEVNKEAEAGAEE